MQPISSSTVQAVLRDLRLAKSGESQSARTTEAESKGVLKKSALKRSKQALKQTTKEKIQCLDRSQPDFTDKVTILAVHEMIVWEYGDTIMDEVQISHIVTKTIQSLTGHPKLNQDLTQTIEELMQT